MGRPETLYIWCNESWIHFGESRIMRCLQLVFRHIQHNYDSGIIHQLVWAQCGFFIWTIDGHCAKFELLPVVVCWDLALCTAIEMYGRFGRTFSLHLKGRRRRSGFLQNIIKFLSDDTATDFKRWDDYWNKKLGIKSNWLIDWLAKLLSNELNI